MDGSTPLLSAAAELALPGTGAEPLIRESGTSERDELDLLATAAPAADLTAGTESWGEGATTGKREGPAGRRAPTDGGIGSALSGGALSGGGAFTGGAGTSTGGVLTGGSVGTLTGGVLTVGGVGTLAGGVLTGGSVGTLTGGVLTVGGVGTCAGGVLTVGSVGTLTGGALTGGVLIGGSSSAAAGIAAGASVASITETVTVTARNTSRSRSLRLSHTASGYPLRRLAKPHSGRASATGRLALRSDRRASVCHLPPSNGPRNLRR